MLFQKLSCQNCYCHQNKSKSLNGSFDRSSFHCICCRKAPTRDGQWEHVLFSTRFSAKIPTKRKELGNKHQNSAEFLNSFCFGLLSKLQRLMPLAPRKLLSKCPPAHTVSVLFMVSRDILHI